MNEDDIRNCNVCVKEHKMGKIGSLFKIKDKYINHLKIKFINCDYRCKKQLKQLKEKYELWNVNKGKSMIDIKKILKMQDLITNN